MGMSLNTTEFDRIFYKLVKGKIPPEAEKGLFEVGSRLLNDARQIPPKAPRDKGDLHSRATVHKTIASADLIALDVGFDIEYAARWHELPPDRAAHINWTEPGSGPKYLESKLHMFKGDYIGMVADAIKRVLRKG